MLEYPLRHLSVRVPWHDAGWAGFVCNAPELNGACARLKGIAAAKKDAQEVPLAGKRLDTLARESWPCCVDERAAFMAPFEMEHLKRHALAEQNAEHYGHFRPTPQRYPAYSAGVVPFFWLMRENLPHFADALELEIDPAREPDLGYDTNWVHEAQNQTALLEAFSAHLRCEESLCFFYAKHVPFIEGTGRILVGAARVKHKGQLTEYRREGQGMRGMVWERPIQHSIRPKGQDGFLVPYYEVLKQAESDPALDVPRYTAHAPNEHWDEFSFASELVTHDGAIAALLSLDGALTRMESDLGIPTNWQREWLHSELGRLWKVRGPYPGLGAVLASFGLSRGVFIAHFLQQKAGENTDPWPLMDEAFRFPAKHLPKELQRDLPELAPTWNALPNERRQFLRLLSRFEITLEQAKAVYDETTRAGLSWKGSDRDFLQNPYRLYEAGRLDPNGLRLMTIDRGVFPDDQIRSKHPLDHPTQLDSGVDLRRIRAFSIYVLESAASTGHTVLSPRNVVEAVRSMNVRPECPINTDMLAARAKDMAPEIKLAETDDGIALQLDRYANIRDSVRRSVLGRVGGARHNWQRDWDALLKKQFGPVVDEEEARARDEKARALAELAASRFSVLAGPAGAGKTSVLGILCGQDEIRKDGLLMLAPTGKARVRMQQLAGSTGVRAQTIAQFLNQHGRYDGRSGRYHTSDGPKATGFATVIVDESSMLTEDMLGALLDALQGVKRLILVGDPAQLPPIGAGRPFVDIIAKLRPPDSDRCFPRVSPGYAELTVERRQIGAERPDLRLARWFSAAPPSAGEDDIFTAGDDEHATIRFVRWDKPEDFHAKLLEVLTQELRLSNVTDQRGFNRSLGAAQVGDYDYFNATRNERTGSVSHVDAWQILSPLRGMPFGVADINRSIHLRFRSAYLELASRQRNRQIPQPYGAERIVYGDKVINLGNHRRDGRRVYPQEGAIGYLANGEIGIAVGQWRTKNMSGPPKTLKVEFSSQVGYTYDFYKSDFREEGDPALELAYALTVHKAQGSQFGLTILILPEAHPIMSRELIYTALTRHQDRVVVMHKGPRTLLKDFTSPERSETARRRTNLLANCRMLEFPQRKGSVFLQEGLIHRTSKGNAVRSKSELLIAEALLAAGVTFEYEKPLTLGGSTRYPDFTIEDEISGRPVYWEHLGMLSRPDYKASWQKKLAWYRKNGVLEFGKESAGAPALVVTSDSAEHGLDMAEVKKLISGLAPG